jgi:transcription elongation factor SPT5
LPSINDPSIWRIKCAPGREFQLVRSIFLKHMAKQATGNTNSTLKSAFHNSSKGYIYVEAMSEVCAKDAIQGLRGLYFTTMTKVPVNEMTNVLRCTTDKVPLKVGQWVRVRRGPFKGDLARVIDIFDGGERCFIMAVPRPDYTLMASDTKKNAKSTIRPSQKLFDSVDASSTGFEVERRSNPSDRRGDFYDYWKNDYYKDGFWFKEVTTETYINNVNVKPKLEELQLFKGRKSGDGLQSDDEDEYDYDDMDAANEDKKAKHLATKNAALGITDGSKLDDADDGDVESNGTILREKRDAPSMQQQLRHELNNQMKQIEDEAAIATVRAVPFVINDIVEVVSGELKGLIAQIVATYDTTDVVDVIPHQSNLLDDRTKISIESSILVKYVTPGNHVKIIDGRYMGTTGRVVSVQILDGDRVCSVLTDGVNTEIQINVSAVQISAEVSMGHGNLGGYEVHDLVSLSENETACIFHVGAEKLR